MRLVSALAMVACLCACAQESHDAGDDKRGYTDTPQLPGQRWKVHDATRPRPPKIRGVVNGAPPSDAVVLFDGKDLSHWTSPATGGNASAEPRWKVGDGYFEIVPNSGPLLTKEKFGDMQLHIEWMIPKGAGGNGQSAGNSGVEIMGRYEVQVLESTQAVTYADGQAAAIYGQYPPLVNPANPEGEWNTYDIVFEAPKFDGDKVAKPAYLTVFFNGVVVHNRKEVLGAAIHRRVATYKPHGAEESLRLQDHHHAVRYRNIWARRLKGYDQQ